MTSDGADAESVVSDGRTTIPEHVRRELGIEDGDRLEWRVESDDVLRVTVIGGRARTFDSFDGYHGETATDATADHDDWGLEER